jgi:glucosamine--fructose-6-phosphate aminotransferase (isomerizing)
MCGIVGAVAQRDIAEILVEGLRRLEYRGYDSAGVAIINAQGELQRVRRLGKVQELASALEEQPLSGGTGIAHTRWATHGEPSEINAHPHVSNGDLAVVHNGIIENHEELRVKLQGLGYEFVSQTDTEVIVHLVHHYLKTAGSLLQALQTAVKELRGAYGTVVMDRRDPSRLVVARSGSPLVIGRGLGENFIASDQLALLPVTRRFLFLEEGDVAEVTRKGVTIFNNAGLPVERAEIESELSHDAGDKGQYRHYMQKEIYEQPQSILNTLEGRLVGNHIVPESFGTHAREIFQKVQHVQIVACGTSYHSGMVARYWFEALAGVSCNIEIASEFRYRKSVVHPNSLIITLSQSGETADTLAALRLAKDMGYMASLTLCNVPGSSLVR